MLTEKLTLKTYTCTHKKKLEILSMIVHRCNPIPWEAEAGEHKFKTSLALKEWDPGSKSWVSEGMRECRWGGGAAACWQGEARVCFLDPTPGKRGCPLTVKCAHEHTLKKRNKLWFAFLIGSVNNPIELSYLVILLNIRRSGQDAFKGIYLHV